MLHAIAATFSAMAQLHAHRRDAFSAATASDIDQSIEPKNICVKHYSNLRRRRVRDVDVRVHGQHGLVVLVRHDDHQVVLLQSFENLFE